MAPVVVFGYKRPDMLNSVLESLAENSLASQSRLFLFMDWQGDDNIHKKLAKVIDKYADKFLTYNVIWRDVHYGLARQVISSISEIFDKFDRAIVVEEDLILDKNALDYFNRSLEAFSHDKTIFNINGYTYSNRFVNPQVFKTGRISSWGWAIWRDRWVSVDWERNLSMSKLNFFRLFLDGLDLYRLITAYNSQSINSWAVRAYYHQHVNRLYSISPTHSFVLNIGYGLNATHTKIVSDRYQTSLIALEWSNFKLILNDGVYSLVMRYHSRWPYSVYSMLREKVITQKRI